MDMADNHPNLTTDAIGFCLLPSELIQNILLHLALPEIMAMKLVNKSIASIISDQNFIRECNLRSKSASWLFVYKKRWCQEAILQGFSDQSTRWFKIAIAGLLKPVISPGENLYFLTASGNIFLFVCNAHRQVIALNLFTKTVKKIPPSTLGPRGTSSWRRSGMKLVAQLEHFRFLFVELIDNRPVLFEYSSETNTWQSMPAKENIGNLPRVNEREDDCIFLNVMNEPYESAVVAITSRSNNAPVIVRPRFDGTGNGLGSITDRLHVYGDGHMVIIRSNGVENSNERMRILNSIEVWGLSLNGRNWEYVSKIPNDLITKMKKPHGVMMGCLEKSKGIIKIVLMSNNECLWEIIWLSYDTRRNYWSWLPLPDCKMKGSNMAGIAFSGGLTLS